MKLIWELMFCMKTMSCVFFKEKLAKEFGVVDSNIADFLIERDILEMVQLGYN